MLFRNYIHLDLDTIVGQNASDCTELQSIPRSIIVKQESPPVGNRTRRTARSLTCPGGGGGSPGGREDTPVLVEGLYPSPSWGRGYPSPGVPLWTGVPPPPGQNWGIPLERTRDLRSGKEPGTRLSPPPRCGRTNKVKTSPSRILRNAGGGGGGVNMPDVKNARSES